VTIYVFFIWAGVALLWYFIYGIRHSHLGQSSAGSEGAP
jgi:basic amino acid/polyamine antiporter, APA family